jgi:hypothetical protein
MEIDREIDSLFVPAIDKASEPGKSTEFDDSVQSNPNRGKGQSGEGPGAAVNLKDLQVKIDAEIDNLLVPAPKSGWEAGPARVVERRPPAKIESKPPPLEDAQKYQMHELSGLIEAFNAAYLSLDWEFSRENIEKFIDALDRLEPFAARSTEARAVLRILDVILKRLRERPHAVNSLLVQLIRDSQGLLAHVLLIEGNTGPHEKQRLKDLIERFQELRQRAIAVKSEAKRTSPHPDTGSKVLELRPRIHLPVAEPPEEPVQIDPSEPLPEVRRENLCLMVSRGKCLAVPASCILKVARATEKKRRKILKRGYAILADFRVLFRRLVSGVMGKWADLPAKDLNFFRFEPLEIDPLDGFAVRKPVAVLASDGENHRIIFCEFAGFIADEEISFGTSAGEAFGPFGNKRRVSVPVFEPQPADSPALISAIPSHSRRGASPSGTGSAADD